MRVKRWMQALTRGSRQTETHQAIIPVTAELFHEMLLMPPTMTIVGVSLRNRVIEVLVIDSQLDAVVEGDQLPQIIPAYSTYDSSLIQAAWPDGRIIGDTFPDGSIIENSGGEIESTPTPP